MTSPKPAHETMPNWPPSSWNGGRDQIVAGGRLRWNPQRPPQYNSEASAKRFDTAVDNVLPLHNGFLRNRDMVWRWAASFEAESRFGSVLRAHAFVSDEDNWCALRTWGNLLRPSSCRGRGA
jgi:hypothetical protein